MRSVGYYYVTVSGYFSRGDNVGGSLLLQFAQPPAEISAPQLQAIKDLWRMNCWEAGMQSQLPVFNLTASAPNNHWTRQHYLEGTYASYNEQPSYMYRDVYSTDGNERDSDRRPFCDCALSTPTARSGVAAVVAAHRAAVLLSLAIMGTRVPQGCTRRALRRRRRTTR